MCAALAGSAGGCGCVGRPEGDPAKSETRLALAKDFLSKNQLEAAAAEADKAIAYLPTNEDAYNLRGLIHVVRARDARILLEVDACLTGVDAEAIRTDLDEQLGLAHDDFAKAAKLAPDYGEAWSNLGTVANLLGDVEEAKKALETALSSPARLDNPGLTRAHLGWAYFLDKQYVLAAKELRQAIQFQPDMCVATYRLGRVYFAREEWEKAAEQFQEVSDRPACQLQEAALYLMKARLEQGLVDDARAAQRACLGKLPNSCIAAQCRAASL